MYIIGNQVYYEIRCISVLWRSHSRDTLTYSLMLMYPDYRLVLRSVDDILHDRSDELVQECVKTKMSFDAHDEVNVGQHHPF